MTNLKILFSGYPSDFEILWYNYFNKKLECTKIKDSSVTEFTIPYAQYAIITSTLGPMGMISGLDSDYFAAYDARFESTSFGSDYYMVLFKKSGNSKSFELFIK